MKKTIQDVVDVIKGESKKKEQTIARVRDYQQKQAVLIQAALLFDDDATKNKLLNKAIEYGTAAQEISNTI